MLHTFFSLSWNRPKPYGQINLLELLLMLLGALLAYCFIPPGYEGF